MQIFLDFQNHVPIYAQIVEQVKGLVAAGALRPGDQLPTVREVATELRVNFNTVARAYRLLHDERVISTQQGRGTYVLGPPVVDESRTERLAKMVGGWLAEVERLGYRPDEVMAAWRAGFEAWAQSQVKEAENGNRQ